ncbi:hypothetical protein F2Q69_00014177 [Brassica cretica]|uniref:Uncharacterized protein n=1 Tax=Brassica cretica TaxID=69181 RepID=A0A8S9QWM3_BRACR|nr:hypothetical protein F2Q69_00014177 [Brassica cretica]
MAKSMRCKRVKRLKAIRREIVEKESFTLTREDAKSAAMAVALAAPKLPGRLPPPSSIMEVAAPTSESASVSANVMGVLDFYSLSVSSLKTKAWNKGKRSIQAPLQG